MQHVLQHQTAPVKGASIGAKAPSSARTSGNVLATTFGEVIDISPSPVPLELVTPCYEGVHEAEAKKNIATLIQSVNAQPSKRFQLGSFTVRIRA